jgi:hypothetical protein
VEGDSWTTVVKKRKPRKAEAKAGATNPSPQNQKGKEEAKAKPKRGAASASDPVKRIRPPRMAAVVLSLQPEAEEMGLSYAQVPTKMCLGIKKEEFSSPVMKRKASAFGACILELAGPPNEVKKRADVLAEKLRQIFPAETLKVARPIKKLDVRLAGLDDAAGPSEVTEAVAKVCDASSAHIHIGGCGGRVLCACFTTRGSGEDPTGQAHDRDWVGNRTGKGHTPEPSPLL